jgi:hypothetical protein
MYLLLILIAGSFFLPSTLNAQANPAKATGFKDFRLGMTRYTVENIIEVSRWEHDLKFGTTLPKESYEMYLKLEGVDVDVDPSTGKMFYRHNGLDSEQQAMLKIACNVSGIHSYCPSLTFIKLMFLDDTLCAIYVASRSYTLEQEEEAQLCVDEIEDDLIRIYGRANDRHLIEPKLPRDSFIKLKPGLYERARWHVSPKRYGSEQSISILFNCDEPGPSKRIFSPSVIFEDTQRASLLYARMRDNNNDK